MEKTKKFFKLILLKPAVYGVFAAVAFIGIFGFFTVYVPLAGPRQLSDQYVNALYWYGLYLGIITMGVSGVIGLMRFLK